MLRNIKGAGDVRECIGNQHERHHRWPMQWSLYNAGTPELRFVLHRCLAECCLQWYPFNRGPQFLESWYGQIHGR
jgi:hypothetical protein